MRLGSSLRRSRKKPASKGRKRKRSGGSSGRRRRTSSGGGDGLRTLGIATLVGLFGGGFGWLVATRLLFPAPPPPSDLRPVPDLTGMTVVAAQRALDDAGLQPSEPLTFNHPSVDSGAVLGQSPLAGQLALPGAQIQLSVSLGPERRLVPEVSRLRGDRALALLEATGFEVVVDSVESPAPRGRILEISPAEGTELTLPGSVALTVSIGPSTIAVPLLLGLDEAEARDTLLALGLEVVEVEEVFRFGRDQGRVVEQDPAEGVEVDRGAGVRLVVGRRGGTSPDR